MALLDGDLLSDGLGGVLLLSGGLLLNGDLLGDGLLNGGGSDGLLSRGLRAVTSDDVANLGRGSSIVVDSLEASSGRGPLGLVLLLSESLVVVTLQGEELLEVRLCRATPERKRGKSKSNKGGSSADGKSGEQKRRDSGQRHVLWVDGQRSQEQVCGREGESIGAERRCSSSTETQEKERDEGAPTAAWTSSFPCPESIEARRTSQKGVKCFLWLRPGKFRH